MSVYGAAFKNGEDVFILYTYICRHISTITLICKYIYTYNICLGIICRYACMCVCMYVCMYVLYIYVRMHECMRAWDGWMDGY